MLKLHNVWDNGLKIRQLFQIRVQLVAMPVNVYIIPFV